MTAPRIPCPDCDRDFPNKGTLRVHAIAKHGADAGECPVCGETFDRVTAHLKKSHGGNVDPGAGTIPPRGPGAGSDPRANLDDDAPLADVVDIGERTPNMGDDDAAPDTTPRSTMRDKITRRLWGSRTSSAPTSSSTAAGYVSNEKTPRQRNARRATTAPIGTLAWGGIGALLQRSGADIPVGRTMQFQSDAAGDILDRLIAHTWFDRVLQPFAQRTDELEALAGLVSLPILVGMVERSDAAAETLQPLLVEAVRANLVAMAPVVKRKRAEAKKFAEAVAELDPKLAATDDPVGTILAAIFAAPDQAPPAPPGANGATVADGAAAI